VYPLDLEVFRLINVGSRSAFGDLFFLCWSSVGLGYVQVGLAVLSHFAFKTKSFTWPIIASVAIAGLPLAQGLKALVPRERPSNMEFAIREEAFMISSFPSGHTATSFGVATIVLLMTWGTRNVKWGWLLAVAAACVGVSRIYRGVHWPSDVVGGVCCGVLAGSLVYFFMLGRSPKTTAS
jgi:undecaprenyl-diphosphatase